MAIENEPSFRESVDIMYNRAVELLDIPVGLKKQIQLCHLFKASWRQYLQNDISKKGLL